MKVKFSLSIGYANADQEEVFEYPEGTPEDEIQRDYRQWSDNYIDGGWWPLEEEED